MDLSIVIVSFNTRELTLNCLKSVMQFLAGKLSFEILVIDNNSGDGSPEAIREYAGGGDAIKVIDAGANVGFAKANNIGITLAKGKQVLLLNSDTYLIDDSLVSAMEYLDKTSNVFGCGCTLLNADKTPGISYGVFPELFTVCRELLTGRFARLRAMAPRRPGFVYDIDLPCGAFFLIKKTLLDRVGPMDEHFFMYCEETDLAKRAWKAGYRIVYFGPTRVVHLGGQSGVKKTESASGGRSSFDLRKIFYQSWSYYLRKHHSRVHASAIKTMLLLYFQAQYLIFSAVHNEIARDFHRKEVASLKSGWNTTEH